MLSLMIVCVYLEIQVRLLHSLKLKISNGIIIWQLVFFKNLPFTCFLYHTHGHIASDFRTSRNWKRRSRQYRESRILLGLRLLWIGMLNIWPLQVHPRWQPRWSLDHPWQTCPYLYPMWWRWMKSLNPARPMIKSL